MKTSFLLISALAAIMLLSSCGKKAVESNDVTQEKKTQSAAEANYQSLLEIEKSVLENNLPSLKEAIGSNPRVDLNQILNSGETFLILSIKNDFKEIRNYLFERKVDIERVNANKETPLHAAISSGKLNSVKALIELKVDIEKKNTNNDTPLIMAIKKNYDEITLTLLKHGANPSAVDQKYKNAFTLVHEYHVPQSNEFLKNLSLLDTNAPDIVNFRQILINVDHRHLKYITMLFPKLLTDYEVLNPLLIVAQAKDGPDALLCAQILMKNNISPDGPKNADQIPLIKAAIENKLEFANLLLSFNANPQLTDHEGKTALIHAVEKNNFKMVQLLTSHYALGRYLYKREGRKIHFNACATSRDTYRRLKTEEEKSENFEIKKILDCFFL